MTEDAKLRGLGQPIPAEKVQGLRLALERDHVVRFKNGSQVEYEDCEKCGATGEVPDPEYPGQDAAKAPKKACATCAGQKVRLLVIRPANGRARYMLDDRGLLSAYAMALRGPSPRSQPSGDGSKFGDEAPW